MSSAANSDRCNIQLVNPYDCNFQFRNFPTLKLQIADYYDRLYDMAVPFDLTARFLYESGIKIGFWDIFYYIDFLYDNSPSTVIDVGCGECLWKKWFPNIIGFDPNVNEFSQQDFVATFDEKFSAANTNSYDCGLALNSLHFIHWDQIEDQIHLAMNIVKQRFLFTFNFSMISQRPMDSQQQLEEFDRKIRSLGYKIILIDYPWLRQPHNNPNSFLNGHARFILQN